MAKEKIVRLKKGEIKNISLIYDEQVAIYDALEQQEQNLQIEHGHQGGARNRDYLLVVDLRKQFAKLLKS